MFPYRERVRVRATPAPRTGIGSAPGLRQQWLSPGPVPAQSAAVSEASSEDFGDAQPHFENRTLRQVVDTTIGGERIRVVFSNAFGKYPLEIGAAQIALHEKDSSIVAKSGRPLTFATPSVRHHTRGFGADQRSRESRSAGLRSSCH